MPVPPADEACERKGREQEGSTRRTAKGTASTARVRKRKRLESKSGKVPTEPAAPAELYSFSHSLCVRHRSSCTIRFPTSAAAAAVEAAAVDYSDSQVDTDTQTHTLSLTLTHAGAEAAQ